jgi:hypothetical protein
MMDVVSRIIHFQKRPVIENYQGSHNYFSFVFANLFLKCRNTNVEHPFDHYVVGREQTSKQDDYNTGSDQEEACIFSD